MPYDPLTLIGYLQSLPRANQNAIPPNFYAPQTPVPQGFNTPTFPVAPYQAPRPQAGATGSWNPLQAGASGGWPLASPMGGWNPSQDPLARPQAPGPFAPGGGLGAALGALLGSNIPGSTGMPAMRGAGGAANVPPAWQGQSSANMGQTFPVAPWRPAAVPPAANPNGNGILSVPIVNPPATGGAGEPPTNQPMPVYPQSQGHLPGGLARPAPAVKAKPKPRPKPAQGNQAKYTSKGGSWEAGRGPGYYEGLSGGFGYQPWRRPKR